MNVGEKGKNLKKEIPPTTQKTSITRNAPNSKKCTKFN